MSPSPMSQSPLSQSPYEVLGVASTATQDDIRRAYRRMLRQTHPDTGGDSARFVAVQEAWTLLGTPEDRAAYDRGHARSGSSTGASWATPSSSGAARPADTRPRSRAFGHPGGWRRERYLALVREWAGRGRDLPDPYDPALVRSAPREIRHILADALAEEATAGTLADLGIGFTVWHDVVAGEPEEKVDHIVLGPTGLFAVLSEDYGTPVRQKSNELLGEGIVGERPFHSLAQRAKRLRREFGVRFTALVIVLPDDELDAPFLHLGSSRGAQQIAVRQSVLAFLLRNGPAGAASIGGNELFDIRSRLQAGIRFV